MEIITNYFPDITHKQKEQFIALNELYKEWNAKINLISRKDIDHLYEKHVLHSLGIAKIIRFTPDTNIMDAGTGGGFPGIPLAILFPDCSFHLVDSTAKKLTAAKNIAEQIGIQHITFQHGRIEDEKQKFHFVVSRALMPMTNLIRICKKNIRKDQQNAFPNGFICLKGGDVQQEIQSFSHITDVFSLSDYFEEDFFNTKKVIYVPA